ncbi:uncharacterized protein LOC129552696 [Moschus berezovskii]|uniref:uncharacterized protein LOC129552696 n=1 Tax=Moschus berezovskii TaxID=68408 RepID=UPI002444E62C|nr:uncharacterized protein LOC129552696 [Moschus berezovskii]
MPPRISDSFFSLRPQALQRLHPPRGGVLLVPPAWMALLATSSQPLASAGWTPRQQPPDAGLYKEPYSACSRGRDGTCFLSPPGRPFLLPRPPYAVGVWVRLTTWKGSLTSLLPNPRHEIGAFLRGLEEKPGWDHLSPLCSSRKGHMPVRHQLPQVPSSPSQRRDPSLPKRQEVGSCIGCLLERTDVVLHPHEQRTMDTEQRNEEVLRRWGKLGAYKETQVTDSKQPCWAGGCSGG